MTTPRTAFLEEVSLGAIFKPRSLGKLGKGAKGLERGHQVQCSFDQGGVPGKLDVQKRQEARRLSLKGRVSFMLDEFWTSQASSKGALPCSLRKGGTLGVLGPRRSLQSKN